MDAAHIALYMHYLVVLVLALISLNGGALTLVFLSKLPVLTQHFFDWLQTYVAHIKNGLAQALLSRSLVVVSQVVLKFENTEIESIKDRLAKGALKPEDLPGVLADLKKNAVSAVKDQLSMQGLMSLLETVVFGSNPSSTTKWIEDTLEAAVAQLPPSGLQTSKGTAPSALALATTAAAAVAKNVVAPAPAPAPASP